MNSTKKGDPFRPGMEYDMLMYLTVTDYCNFSCPGCIGFAKKAVNGYSVGNIDIQKLTNSLDKLNKVLNIIITGGEPLLVENIIEILSELTKKHFIGLITNLTNPRVRQFAGTIDPKRVDFVRGSSHLLELEKQSLLDTYFDHFNLLQVKGFNIYNEEIAYPVLADRAEKYKKLFKARNIDLTFNAYHGKWGGKTYPEAYTSQELAKFNLFSDPAISNPEINNRKGKLCNAGYNVFVAFSDGNVTPCYQLNSSLGNIYGDFKLKNSLVKCPWEKCSCPFPDINPRLFEKAMREIGISLAV
jgi:MoaA/NifB/PqqE/SkfB family radical SAM enzyme